MSAFKQSARHLAIFSLVALFGGLAGFVIAAGNGITLDGHDHNTDHNTDHGEIHGKADGETDGHAAMHDMPHILDENTPAPRLSITLHKDPVAGYNLQLTTDNFIFSGANAGNVHQAGEGHAHLYIDGVKQARIYGQWTHLSALPDTAKHLSVSLNSNDHRPLSHSGTRIEAKLSLADFK